MAEERAGRAVARLMHDREAAPVSDPFDALLRLAGRLEAAADLVGGRVNALGSVRTTDAKHAEQVRGEVQVWMALNEQLRKALAEIVRLDIAGRQVALNEQQATVVERVIVAVLTKAGVPLDERVRGIVYRELTAARPRVIEAVS